MYSPFKQPGNLKTRISQSRFGSQKSAISLEGSQFAGQGDYSRSDLLPPLRRLDFGEVVGSTLAEDDVISQFMSQGNDESTERPAESMREGNAMRVPQNGIFRPSQSFDAIQRAALAEQNAKKTIRELRAQLAAEVHRRGSLMTKYEELLRAHVRLRTRVEEQNIAHKSERNRLHANALETHTQFRKQLNEAQKAIQTLDGKATNTTETHDELRNQLSNAQRLAQIRDNEAADMQETHEQLRRELVEIQRLTQQGEHEASQLRKQNTELKQSIATSTKMDSQTTDHVFSEEMTKLLYEIQNWVVKSFRKSRLSNNFAAVLSNEHNLILGLLDFTGISVEGKKVIEIATPLFELLPQPTKIPFCQCVVIANIMEIFKDELYWGLPPSDTYNTLRSTADYIHGKLESRIIDLPLRLSFVDISAFAGYNQWRSTTVRLLNNAEDQRLTQYTRTLIRRLTDRIEKTLCEVMQVESNHLRQQELRDMISHAVDLSRLFRFQLAKYEFELPLGSPESPRSFDGTTMEDMQGDGREDEDDEDGQDTRNVQLAISPIVYKIGGERGDQVSIGKIQNMDASNRKQMHLKNVILKAKVVCIQR